ncbi:outer membrane protein transport protein [bacterium]|nr:outer membrane protein transport protein [bacterium]
MLPISPSRSRAHLLLLLVALLTFAGPALGANGAKPTAYGTKAAGRGGVDYAIADDATGPATNPAGMAFIPNRLDEAWLIADAQATFRNNFGSERSVPKLIVPLPAYSFGVVWDPSQSTHIGDLFKLGDWGLKPAAKDPPLDFYEDATAASATPTFKATRPEPAVDQLSLRDEAPEATDAELYGGRFRFGIGVFPVSGGAFRYRHIQTEFWPGSIEERTDALMLAVTPSLAYRITKEISIGYAPQFIYATFKFASAVEQPRNVVLTPPFALNAGLVQSPTIRTYSISHDLSTFGFSQRLGIMYSTPHSESFGFSVGAVYQDRTYLQDYLGSSSVDANVQTQKLTFNNLGLLQVINPSIQPNQGFISLYNMRVQNLQMPRMGGVGLSVRPASRFSFGLDYTYIDWHELYRVFRVRLSNPSNTNLLIMSGSSIHVKLPLDYKDQHVIAAGASVVALRGDDLVPGKPSYQLILRAGYNWGQNPVPKNTALPKTPIFFEHHVSGGFTFEWGPYLDLSFAVEHAFMSSVHTGINHANQDFSFSSETVKATVFVFGFGVNF